MNRKAASGTMLTLLLIGTLTLAFNAVPTTASLPVHNIDTGLDYTTIQEAINDNETLDGHTIFVEEGTYYGCVRVYKSISLIGQNRETTIIDGRRTITVVYVGADDVLISGFTIQRSAIGELDEYGIHLAGKNNVISGNIIRDNDRGIYMLSSPAYDSNIIVGNYITGNRLGVRVYGSHNLISENIFDDNDVGIQVTSYMKGKKAVERNVFSRNLFTNNLHAMDVDWTKSSVVTGNNFTKNLRGLDLFSTGNYTITHNCFSENQINFGVSGFELSHFINEVDDTNIINGKRIYYLINKDNVTLDSSTFPDAGYVAIINSTNMNVRDLELKDNYSGLLFSYTNNSSIENVTCSNCWSGIELFHSSDVFISGNEANNNYHGIEVRYSSPCSISDNNVKSNWYGIILVNSSDNRVFHNNFINNTDQMYVTAGHTNVWDDGFPSGGNYWSDDNPPDGDMDKIGDVPYIIDDDNIDEYPLVYPFNYVPSSDVNDDGIVDIFDVVTVAKAFGCIPGEPNWNPMTDINGSTIDEIDEIIDIFDIVTIAKDFGETV